MDLQLKGRHVSVVGPDEATVAVCQRVLASEGAVIAAPAAQADVVVAVGGVHPGSDILEVQSVDELYDVWTDVTRAVEAFRASLPRMLDQQWGRLVWVGSAQAKSVDAEADELAAIASLGMLGLNKVVTGEVGSRGITANAVLRGGSATAEDVADAVAFLCSQGAGYLSGITITVDGGAGSGVF